MFVVAKEEHWQLQGNKNNQSNIRTKGEKTK
jgi:hypothetical protein